MQGTELTFDYCFEHFGGKPVRALSSALMVDAGFVVVSLACDPQDIDRTVERLQSFS